MQTQKFFHVLYVEAVRVTADNLDEIAEWCKGRVDKDKYNRSYVQVPIVRTVKPRPDRAFFGNWVVLTGGGFKVFKANAFNKTFSPISESDPAAVQLLEKIFSNGGFTGGMLTSNMPISAEQGVFTGGPTPALGTAGCWPPVAMVNGETAALTLSETANPDEFIDYDVVDPIRFQEMLASRQLNQVNQDRRRAGIDKR